MEYYQKSLKLSRENNEDSSEVISAVNIADSYNKLGDFKTAKKYLEGVREVPKSIVAEHFVTINYAESLMLEGRDGEAQKMVEGLVDKVGRLNYDGDCYTCIVGLLSKVYNNQGKTGLAISFAEKALKNGPSIEEKIDLYSHLSDIYYQRKEYDIFKRYKDSVIFEKDSIAAKVNRGLFESNKVKFKVQEYQNELQATNEKQKKERTLFIIGILFTLMLFFAIYNSQKNRIIKQKQEKVIAENRQKIFDLEIDNLKNNIAEKNRSLSAKALYLSSRNELIEEVINSLSLIPEISDNKQVSEYTKTLKSYLKTDDEWENFINYFEQVNPEFLKKLTAKFPDLNPADVRFLCYIYMNLDIREIGNIFNITYNAALKRQRRIKEKMEVDKELSLYEYLLQLV